MTWLLRILILAVSLDSYAKSWSQLGFKFYAPDDLYEKNETKLLKVGQEIGSHLNFLLRNKIPREAVEKINTEKINFVFTPTYSADALFFAPGFYSGFHESELKRKSVIQINPSILNQINFLRLVSHEFFHFIHFEINPVEVDWIREGLAQYFEYMVHQSINYTNIDSALGMSRSPIETNFNPQIADPEKYGNSFLFFNFLFKHCGGRILFWDFVNQANHYGRNTLEIFLKNNIQDNLICSSVQSVMSSFVLAKMINGPSNKMSDLTIAWDIDQVIESSHEINNQLNKLDENNRELFIKRLPSFLGIKVPVSSSGWINSKLMDLLINESVVVYYVSTSFPPKVVEIKAFKDLIQKSTGDLVIFKNR